MKQSLVKIVLVFLISLAYGTTTSWADFDQGGCADPFALASEALVLTVADVGPFTYNGVAQTPNPLVTYGDFTLLKDRDYTLAYANNLNAGEATLTVTVNIGNGTTVVNKVFTIDKATITVTPDADQTKIFRDDDPVLTYTSTL
ncbi:MAG: hypothetical protein GX617_15580, partial [Lentisphaerae bacterium]|nr:hypothetical protein [Lentisphaerota bacterium]